MSKSLHLLKTGVLTVAIVAGIAIQSGAQERRPMRQHSATEAKELTLVPATRTVKGARVKIKERDETVVIRSNGLPTHAVGQFPNSGNPHRINAQKYRFEAEADQMPSVARALGLAGLFGVAVNGVPFDPGAAEFWRGNPASGWQYEALGGAVRLGLDQNFAHVQPSGAYHYHGLPTGLMQQLGWSRSSPSPLIGYAADGHPIYAITANINGAVVEMTSSWRLKPGNRPGGRQPAGRHDGAFVEDYTYVAGSGTLDECNGATVVTEDYPDGTYAYFLTDSFPVVPRCLKGESNASFAKRRGRV